jgi:hypothetical protein
VLITRPVRKGLSARVKTQEPRPDRMGFCFGKGGTVGENGRWVHRGGNARDTLPEGNASKGESQERCRHEIRLARARKE